MGKRRRSRRWLTRAEDLFCAAANLWRSGGQKAASAASGPLADTSELICGGARGAWRGWRGCGRSWRSRGWWWRSGGWSSGRWPGGLSSSPACADRRGRFPVGGWGFGLGAIVVGSGAAVKGDVDDRSASVEARGATEGAAAWPHLLGWAGAAGRAHWVGGSASARDARVGYDRFGLGGASCPSWPVGGARALSLTWRCAVPASAPSVAPCQRPVVALSAPVGLTPPLPGAKRSICSGRTALIGARWVVMVMVELPPGEGGRVDRRGRAGLLGDSSSDR